MPQVNGLRETPMKASKVPTIKQLLDRDQYRIDPQAIADAIIRWLHARPAAAQLSPDTPSEQVLEP
jgi:hypothetical protein